MSSPEFPSFDAISDTTQVGQRWTVWIARFENYLIAKAITDDARKLACLLHYGGEQVYAIYQTLNHTREANETAFKQAVRVLTAHFNPKKNKEYAIYLFNKAKQGDDENIHQFYTRLVTLSKHCEFHDKDASIKSQIIRNCTSDKLRNEGLANPDWDLAKLLQQADTWEVTKVQAKHIKEGVTGEADSEATINKINHKGKQHSYNKYQESERRYRSPPRESRGRGRRNQYESRRPERSPRRYHEHSPRQYRDRSSRQHRDRSPHYHRDRSPRREEHRGCKNCGGNYHRDGLSYCPARGKRCSGCGRWDHFAKVCMQKEENRPDQGSSRREDKPKEDLREKLNNISERSREKWDRRRDESSSSSSSYDENNMYVLHTAKHKSKNGTPSVKTKINSKNVDFHVDSGAGKTVMDQSNYKRVGKPALRPTGIKLFPYGSPTPLQLLGKFETKIALASDPNQFIMETVYVIKMENSGCLLGNSASQRLNLIELSSEINLVQREKSVIKEEKLGKMKDIKVQLHIDQSVKPVAIPHRRIPYNLRKKVEAELDRLEKLDIIEKVKDEETTWMSPVVVVPKKKAKRQEFAQLLNDPNEAIRVCVDMRKPNQAIKRERHICPTIEDITSVAAGSKIFSKIDLSRGYHQLELAEESRHITTFSTHAGLYRYKRLFFGVTSAAEIFQNIIQSILSDIDGVINASDDIHVVGRTREEHDRRLNQVLSRLREKNITINE